MIFPLQDRHWRTIWTAAAVLIFDLLYALYNGVLGILNQSVWLITMCAYYSILGTARFLAVLHIRYQEKSAPLASRLVGCLLILLSVVLAGVNYLCQVEQTAVRYHKIAMIAIAAYTFAKIGMVTARTIRDRKDPSPLLSAIRHISCAETAAALFTLQRSMLVSFEGMAAADIRRSNAAAGCAVFLFVLSLGLSMVKQN